MVAAVTHTDEQLSYCSLSINPVLGISLHMAFTLAQCSEQQFSLLYLYK